MNKDMKRVAKKTAKYAGAFAVGTGVFALSALVASGAAVGAVAEGFKAAGNAAKRVLDESKFVDAEIEEVKEFNDVVELTEIKDESAEESNNI